MSHQPSIDTENKEQRPSKFMAWLKKLGLAGFLFFLFKGIVWLFVLFGLGKCVVG